MGRLFELVTLVTLLTRVIDGILPKTVTKAATENIHSILLNYNFPGIDYSAGLLQSLVAKNPMTYLMCISSPAHHCRN